MRIANSKQSNLVKIENAQKKHRLTLMSIHPFVLAFSFCLEQSNYLDKAADIPECLREMPESISWVIISVPFDTLSSGTICSRALWRPVLMQEIS